MTTRSCNCGVAIREGSNVVSVGQCVAPFLNETTFLHVVRHSKFPFSNGFQVFRNLQTVKVLLSSGSYVEIKGKTFGVNVELRLSPIYTNTTGICGNGNGKPEDDLTGRDGIMYTNHKKFTETWR